MLNFYLISFSISANILVLLNSCHTFSCLTHIHIFLAVYFRPGQIVCAYAHRCRYRPHNTDESVRNCRQPVFLLRTLQLPFHDPASCPFPGSFFLVPYSLFIPLSVPQLLHFPVCLLCAYFGRTRCSQAI